MEAGRDLDALVAEKVMGFSWWHSHQRNQLLPIDANDWAPKLDMVPGKCESEYKYINAAPAYSTDIAEAWKVIEHLHKSNIGVEVSTYPDGKADAWTLENLDGENPQYYECTNNTGLVDSAPLAICLAALKALD